MAMMTTLKKALFGGVGLLCVGTSLSFATITISPAQPNVEQTATLTLSGILGTIVAGSPQWNFGDGTTSSGTATVTKRYLQAASFLVTVVYRVNPGGQFPIVTRTESVSITVNERRQISYAPQPPLVDKPITFTAENFNAADIQWNFGDGTAPVMGGPTAVKTYVRAGIYTVSALDLGGSSQVPITITLNVGDLRRITYSPQSPLADKPVTFTAENFNAASIRWNFGDGTAPVMSGPTVVKTFVKAGTYTVSALDLGGSSQVPITVTLNVQDLRRITFTPPNPFVLQTVMLTALNFQSASILWDFGDDSGPVLLTAQVTHAFPRPGLFAVKARDLGGNSATEIKVNVVVDIDPARRRLASSLPNPSAGRPVTFTAANFYTTNIRWDFGDGTLPVTNGAVITHTYAKTGTFTVRAWDWDGQYGEDVTMIVVVIDATGPRAAFQIYFIQIRFEDGKSYKVVPKDSKTLRAFADIKYEGTGIFRAQWLVDGMPFRLSTQALPFAQATTLDSGTTPALPTHMPGMHEVTLRIDQPQSDFTIPVIRYFVSVEPAGRPLDMKALNVQVESAVGLKGVECTLKMDTLKIPAGRYVIMNGTVRCRNEAPVKFALLRIHIGRELVDQQILRDLKPDDERAFLTSILNDSPAEKKIYIALYDITERTSKLLYLKSMKILPNLP